MAGTAEIQKLREKTGAGVMECKRALEEAGGDLHKAAELIYERGLAKAEKRAGREAGAGLIDAYVHQDRVGALVQLNCETDFVARSDEFRRLAHEVAMQVVAMDPQSVEELLSSPYIRDEKATIDDLVKQAIAQLGENIKVVRFSRFEL